MGLSDRTIRADLELYNKLSGEVRKRVAGTWLADARNQLRNLAKLHKSDQDHVLDLILGPEPKAKKVVDAVCIIENRPKARTDHDKLMAALWKRFLSLPKKQQKAVVVLLREGGHIKGGGE